VEAQQELDFIREFQGQVIEMISLVGEWEQRDAQFIAAQPDGSRPDDVHRDTYHSSYENLCDQISNKMGRFNSLCRRYDFEFPECLLFVMPTKGRGGDGVRAGVYRFSFPIDVKTEIFGTIRMVEGAASRHLEQEARREAEGRAPE